MKFHFRFASILDLRRRERDEAGGMVGEANAAIGKVEDQIEAIEQERKQLAIDDAEKRVGDVSVDRLLARGRYDLQLQADIHELRETRLKLIEELERRQQRLRDAETEVKKFERMMEMDLHHFRNEINRREQIEIDEMNNRRDAVRATKH
ncbi:flagellar biosynthesis chaperone [Planctomycetes bacterium CA13]|uniref:Flagellar FliJ protein n=1 Tax=Novipirellula herctigrandis TaxID=2527986 RepID=A0A5C5Z829_9BACT|nr:flagellar biosynthesis chaperone [Planctomycetes bacterium CA13]